MDLTRRGAVAGALAGAATLSGCDRGGASQAATPGEVAPLKQGAICPVGAAISTVGLDDPAYPPLFAKHFSQCTADWQMKMEIICGPNGTYNWEKPDRIAAWARDNNIRLHGHTLVWYAQNGPIFEQLDGQKPAFENAYRDYITTVVKRYKAASWDVLNEPIEEDGGSLRVSHWSKNLGEIDHMLIAFETAHEADPNAVLFINEYFLEKLPKKRLAYMRLIERLLKAGCKLGGIGVQSHLDIDVQPGMCRAAIKDVASFGLPIHIAELDCTFSVDRTDLRAVEDKLQVQAQLAQEVAETFAALPAHQRHAFTVWGLRDKDSWLLKYPENQQDQPLLFDNDGRPKPMFDAVAAALKAKKA